MTKRVYLLRHAKSGWDDPSLDDHDRPLNARGFENAELVARHMRKARYAPALVLCSSARRTVETMDKIAAALPEDSVRQITRALYLAAPQNMFELLKTVEDAVPSVMVIAHSPGTEQLALLLARKDGSAKERANRKQIEEKFPTAALAVLSLPATRWQELAPHTATLDAFIRPRDL